MKMQYGKLDEHFNVIPLGIPKTNEDLKEMEKALMNRWKEHTYLGDSTSPETTLVSTVFLGLEHDVNMWFETGIHRNGDWDIVQRYSTYKEAIEGHKHYVEVESSK